jgi:uncharacterized protein (DUF1501 family)
MKANGKIQSRRALLQIGVRSLAGAGLLGTLEQVSGASTAPGNRALVCIYLFGGEGASFLPNVSELKALHRQELLAVVKHDAPPSSEVLARRYQALRFLPNGFATLEWAAQKAGIHPLTGAGAFTFHSGLSMLALGGSQPQGDQFENITLRQAMKKVEPPKTAFPDTTIGRQLEDVSRLLQAGRALGLNRPVFLCTANGFTRSAQRVRTVSARYRDLGQAMAAFHAATVELGLDRQVTTYTDAEFSAEGSSRVASRLILGGAAMESEIVKSASVAADTYSDSLAHWHALA